MESASSCVDPTIASPETPILTGLPLQQESGYSILNAMRELLTR